MIGGVETKRGTRGGAVPSRAPWIPRRRISPVALCSEASLNFYPAIVPLRAGT